MYQRSRPEKANGRTVPGSQRQLRRVEGVVMNHRIPSLRRRETFIERIRIATGRRRTVPCNSFSLRRLSISAYQKRYEKRSQHHRLVDDGAIKVLTGSVPSNG
ncbi:hypothetical protein FF2_035035 [Malus domestica]